MEPNPTNCSVRVITEDYLDGGYIWGGSEQHRPKDLLLSPSPDKQNALT